MITWLSFGSQTFACTERLVRITELKKKIFFFLVCVREWTFHDSCNACRERTILSDCKKTTTTHCFVFRKVIEKHCREQCKFRVFDYDQRVTHDCDLKSYSLLRELNVERVDMIRSCAITRNVFSFFGSHSRQLLTFSSGKRFRKFMIDGMRNKHCDRG